MKSFESEFDVLLNAEEKEIYKATSENIANNIMRNRSMKIPFTPGYHGEYGIPIFDEKEVKKKVKIKKIK